MRQKNREIQELSYTKIVKFGTIRLCSVVTKRKSVTMCTVPIVFSYFFTSFTNNNLKFKSNIVPGESNLWREKNYFPTFFRCSPGTPPRYFTVHAIFCFFIYS